MLRWISLLLLALVGAPCDAMHPMSKLPALIEVQGKDDYCCKCQLSVTPETGDDEVQYCYTDARKVTGHRVRFTHTCKNACEKLGMLKHSKTTDKTCKQVLGANNQIQAKEYFLHMCPKPPDTFCPGMGYDASNVVNFIADGYGREFFTNWMGKEFNAEIIEFLNAVDDLELLVRAAEGFGTNDVRQKDDPPNDSIALWELVPKAREIVVRFIMSEAKIYTEVGLTKKIDGQGERQINLPSKLHSELVEHWFKLRSTINEGIPRHNNDNNEGRDDFLEIEHLFDGAVHNMLVLLGDPFSRLKQEPIYGIMKQLCINATPDMGVGYGILTPKMIRDQLALQAERRGRGYLKYDTAERNSRTSISSEETQELPEDTQEDPLQTSQDTTSQQTETITVE